MKFSGHKTNIFKIDRCFRMWKGNLHFLAVLLRP
jgi:hypothetical protein